MIKRLIKTQEGRESSYKKYITCLFKWVYIEGCYKFAHFTSL